MKKALQVISAIILPITMCAVESAPLLTASAFLLVALVSELTNDEETNNINQ